MSSNVSRRQVPTIEIFAIGQCAPVSFTSDAFALETERAIKSHRSLFAKDLAGVCGCTYHLGNKECETRGFYFGSRLLSERHLDGDSAILEFTPVVKLSVIALMNTLDGAADTDYLLLLTDYQFGPIKVVRESFHTLQDFWNAHDTQRLRLNALFSIGRNG